MQLFITKNGQQYGPYSMDDVHRQVQTGAFLVTDLAWYTGLPGWTPLNQIPGFSAGLYDPALQPGLAAPPAPVQSRPVLVWIICLFYFVTIPLGVVGLLFAHLLQSLMLSGGYPIPEAQRTYMESMNGFDYALRGVALVLSLSGAIFLFLLKRPALYFFLGNFLLGIADLVYQITCKNWLALVDQNVVTLSFAVFILGFSYTIYLSVIGYVIYLYLNKTLR